MGPLDLAITKERRHIPHKTTSYGSTQSSQNTKKSYIVDEKNLTAHIMVNNRWILLISFAFVPKILEIVNDGRSDRCCQPGVIVFRFTVVHSSTS